MIGDRPVVLVGMMGAGKSTVGLLLSQRTGRPFIDTDRWVEDAAGQSISEIFRQQGEAEFRSLERDAVTRALEVSEAIIAVGGGAIMDETTRALLNSKATVIWLHASPQILLERVGGASGRPLLENEDQGRALDRLLRERMMAYEESDHRVETDGRTPEAVADGILGAPMIATHGADHTYPVHVVAEDLSGAAARIRAAFPKADRLFVVADQRAAELHGDALAASLEANGFQWQTVRLEVGEGTKVLGTVTRLWHQMAQAHVDRDVPLLALGGGVTTDIAGYAAASWKRGLPWIAMPTTLLGQVDAAIGGKTGINLPEGKNLIGAFHPPSLVVMATGVLATLGTRELSSGMAEVIKTGIIGDPDLLNYLDSRQGDIMGRSPDALAEVVRRCAAVKIRIVAADPEEKNGQRRVLNLGHTAGHAIETSTGFSRYTHGEAVSLGLVLACRLATEEGLLEVAESERITGLLAAYGLPTATDAWTSTFIESWRPILAQDKKIGSGQVRFLLPNGLGRVKEVEYGLDEALVRLGRAAAISWSAAA